MKSLVRIGFPYLLFAAIVAGVLWSNLDRNDGGASARAIAGSAGPAVTTLTATGSTSLAVGRCRVCGMALGGDGLCPMGCVASSTTRETHGPLASATQPATETTQDAHSPAGSATQPAKAHRALGVSLGADGSTAAIPPSLRLIDPVCHMEVNRAWGYRATRGAKTYHFCTERCRRDFLADPVRYIEERCPVCDAAIADAAVPVYASYHDRTYTLCSEEHRRTFLADPASFFMHRMWGIPSWLYYASIALVLLVSFLVLEGPGLLTRRKMTGLAPTTGAGPAGALLLPGKPPASPPARFDLLRVRWISALLRSRGFRFTLQAFFVAAFGLIVAAGLFGNQNPALNLAPLLTWTVWWGGLVVLIAFAGKAWCYVCPWDAIASWLRRFSFWNKSSDEQTLDLKWPRVLRNILLATVLFVGLTWFELGFGVTMRPRATAYLALGMLGMAIVSALLFQRQSFCRYGCLVGRVSGLYALFSGVEVRARDQDICKTCLSKECIHGSETAYGCPTFQYPGAMTVNTYCIQCMECVQACPKDNLAVNLRPWGADLASEGRPRTDEAYLALLMLAITGFHGLTMTPVWRDITAGLAAGIGEMLAFSAGMVSIMLAPVLVYAVLAWASWWIACRTVGADGGVVSYREWFVRYAYSVLPIALFYHLAHNLEHLLMEGPKVVALLSDPFGWGWNLFGTAGWSVPPLVSLDALWVIQIVLVAVGHVYSLWAAKRISGRLVASKLAAARSQWPMLLGMILFSFFSLWLLKQPMEMRISAM